jgi:hypothetical protein
MGWTSEQILALAPDSGSAKSGKDLASPRKWTSLGQDGKAAWGLCQGSGKDPYQTRIDLSEPAFKCSCPSRKFPCKHSLGLFLILADQPKVFTETKRPAWVEEWISTRQEKAEKKVEKKQAESEREADPEVQAKRAKDQAKRSQAREEKVAAGLEELDRFIRDVVRQGLASVQNKPYSFWEGMAAHLIDAQAPGLARLVRELGGAPSSGDGWQERLLEQLSRIHLILEGYKRIAELPPDTQADLRAMIGFTINQDAVLAQSGIRDKWMVLGQRVDEEEKLKVQRSWLWGRTTKRPALVLHFAHASQPLDISLVPGTQIDAEIVFFQSAFPLRALVKTKHGNPEQLVEISGFSKIADAVAAYTNGLKSYPWLEQFPLPLENVVPVQNSGAWAVRDGDGHALAFSSYRGEGWRLAALSGGRPVQIFGEWDGKTLRPLSAWSEKRFVPC